MKSILRNNKGMALVTALMLTMITLGIIMSMLYMITQATKISGATKKYHNVTEAAFGGGELLANDVIGMAWKNYSSAGGVGSQLNALYGSVGLSMQTSDPCFKQKLSSASANWAACTPAQKSVDLPSIKGTPDLSFVLKGTATGTNYKVYAKIVDTTAGNTDTASSSLLNASDAATGLVGAAGSAYNRTGGGTIAIQHIPFVYRLEIQGEKEINPSEKSNVSVLYAY